MNWPTIERDAKSAPFFDAAARGELVVRRCDDCGQALPPEAAVCTGCAGTALSWEPVSGHGTVASWTVVRRAPHRAYADLVPYCVAVVELDEGPWLYVRMESTAPTVWMAVRARFARPADGEAYPVFVEDIGETS